MTDLEVSSESTSPETNPKQLALDAARSLATQPPGTRGKAQLPRRDIPMALIYLRVSTKEQARTGGGSEGYSIPAQREACYAKAKQMGVTVHDEYVDAGESAR